MVYEINEELEENIENELLFSYHTAEFSQKDGREYCITDCGITSFGKAYQRSICEYLSDLDGVDYATEEEMNSPEMRKLITSVSSGPVRILDTEKTGFAFRTAEFRPSAEKRTEIETDGNAGRLAEEFTVRYYDAGTEERDGKEYCIVRDCTDEAIEKIVKRAKCMERSEKEGLLCLTEEESMDDAFCLLLGMKYHTSAFLTVRNPKTELDAVRKNAL